MRRDERNSTSPPRVASTSGTSALRSAYSPSVRVARVCNTDTPAPFRTRHLVRCSRSATRRLARPAFLHVALDGTKIKANASKHKAMSYERMENRAAELEAEVAKWLSAAEAADAAEDKLYGRDKTGDEMPDWVADKKLRAERIRKAKAELEAEAKAAAEAKRKAEAAAAEKRAAAGRRKPGRQAAPPSTEPDAKDQKNFTDPQSRIMKSKDGFVQAYNAQAAVDAEAQIIVAHDVTQSPVDCGQLVPMTDAIETNLGRKPEQLSADAGYCSEANLEALEKRSIDAYVATGRARDAVAGAVKGGSRPHALPNGRRTRLRGVTKPGCPPALIFERMASTRVASEKWRRRATVVSIGGADSIPRLLRTKISSG